MTPPLATPPADPPPSDPLHLKPPPPPPAPPPSTLAASLWMKSPSLGDVMNKFEVLGIVGE
ncbi:Cyclin-dependent kinase-like 5, partial [Dissostichus eleginoides]